MTKENLNAQDIYQQDQEIQMSMQERIEEQLAINRTNSEAVAEGTDSEVFADRSSFVNLKETNESRYEEIIAACETVMDPELGIDIVNLGLIYEVYGDEAANIWIQMTFTTPGCPLGDVILGDVHQAVSRVAEVDKVKLELVWTPAWHPEMLSRYARIALGFV